MDPSALSASNAIQNDASSTLSCQTGDIHEGSECVNAECIVNVAIILGLGCRLFEPLQIIAKHAVAQLTQWVFDDNRSFRSGGGEIAAACMKQPTSLLYLYTRL